ncbi:MAG: hypothetical protein M0R31_06415, partial [Candidatus Riflebacteria bacterium]|nr:hypothetical protein [Candidatus Riflebacteria bacterium]
MTHWKNLANYDYLGAYSLKNGKDKIVTIKEIKQELVTGNGGRKENCIVAHFSDEEKPMILNKTNCKTIQKVYSTPLIEEWVGKKIVLFASTTSLAGETVECLRIRPYPPVADKPAPKCEECGADITGVGKMTAEATAIYTEKKYGDKLCAECATRRAAE